MLGLSGGMNKKPTSMICEKRECRFICICRSLGWSYRSFKPVKGEEWSCMLGI